MSAMSNAWRDGIVVIDQVDRIIYMNQSAMDVTALSVGGAWEDAFPVSHDPLTLVADCREDGNASCVIEVPSPIGSSWLELHGFRMEYGGQPCVCISIRDVSDETLGRQRLEAVSGEMRHRLNNIYGIASTIIKSSAGKDPVLLEFAETVSGRLASLARVQGILASRPKEAPLSSVMDVFREVFIDDHMPITLAECPDVLLNGSQLQAVSLVMGELMANSKKYGALCGGGRISVICRIEGEATLQIVWRETFLYKVASTPGGGSGVGLMQRIMRSVRGSFSLDIGEAALVATTILPVQTSI